MIAFRSFRDGENSVVYVMNTDGTDVRPVSDPAGYALNQVWSPDSSLIAYDSNVDGDDDLYVYELATDQTRHFTDNGIADYAPTWYCESPILIFTSEIEGDSNIYEASALPIDAPAIDVEVEASQLTTLTSADQYPERSPNEENASREEQFPSPVLNR
jgi:Tol biopolymer transport system component